VTDANRRSLIALVAAGTKLDAAASLAKQAAIDLATAGLLPPEPVQRISAEIDVLISRIALLIERIPST